KPENGSVAVASLEVVSWLGPPLVEQRGTDRAQRAAGPRLGQLWRFVEAAGTERSAVRRPGKRVRVEGRDDGIVEGRRHGGRSADLVGEPVQQAGEVIGWAAAATGRRRRWRATGAGGGGAGHHADRPARCGAGGRRGATIRRSGCNSPRSSKTTTPLHSRLHPCSG